jgi:glutathione synthase/RimK-type ligase-like ATP-grasp enzyme
MRRCLGAGRATLMLLLVTNQRDITTDFVVLESRRRGIDFFRLNTELLPSMACSFSDRILDDWTLTLDGRTVCGSQVSGAYFRRPGKPRICENIIDDAARRYAESEWASLLKSLYTRLEGRWLNSPTQIVLAEDKPRQLLLAHRLGFDVPAARITNDLQTAQQITEHFNAIAKPLRESLLTGERESVMFTTRLDGLCAADAPALALAPIIVQQEIAKQYDVRVTVVGQRVFAVAIGSQAHAETAVDWRRGSHADLKHELIQLPERLQQQCIELTRALGLRFGAIDLICDQDDRFWFLEINPNGQWAWLENMTGAPITSAIVDELQGMGRPWT